MTRQEHLQCEREDRAFALLEDPLLFWRFAHALDVLGWKITPQDQAFYGDERMTAPLRSKRKHWPNWIDDRRKPPSPPLRLVEKDDGGQEPPAG